MNIDSNLSITNTGLNNANKAIESNSKTISELSKTTISNVLYTTYIDETNSVVNLKKKNNQVNLGISCKLKSGIGAGQSWTAIFTLPEGFRPKDGEYGSGCSLNGITCGVNIATDGSVTVNPSKDMTGDFEVIYARLSFYTD